MEEANLVTSITLVTYPSNHCLISGPKIALIGSGSKWKEDIIEVTNNFWSDSPITFFYVDTDEYDLDSLSWLYLNLKNADFLIGKVGTNLTDIAILAPFCREASTFMLFDNDIPLEIRAWFNELNSNSELYNALLVILKIKELCQVINKRI
jgi:hypothetical protein